MRFSALLLRSRGAVFLYKETIHLNLLIFNQQIMTFLFDLFLRVKLYQLLCLCIDHILDGFLDAHIKSCFDTKAWLKEIDFHL